MAGASSTAVRTNGLREFIRACDAAGKETKKQVRNTLRQAAGPVLDDARARLSEYDPRSAARLRTVVRRTGLVTVEQTRRKTTGQHPQFGALQMTKALLPAAAAHEDEIGRLFEHALDEVADIIEGG